MVSLNLCSLYILTGVAGSKDTWMAFTVAVTNRSDSSPDREAATAALCDIDTTLRHIFCVRQPRTACHRGPDISKSIAKPRDFYRGKNGEITGRE